MSDLEKLTDEELKALSEETIETENNDLSQLSDDELQTLAKSEGAIVEDDYVSDVTALESGARGLAQGATFGFADEITGAVESAMTDKSYEQARNESRAAFEKAKNANEALYYGGELVGGIASGIATGGYGAGVRGAAILGGIYSLGSSNATGIELAKDVAIGTALGAGGEKVFKGIGRYAKGIFNKASPTTKKVAETLSNSTDNLAASLETNWLKFAYSKGLSNADDVLTDPQFMSMTHNHAIKAPKKIQEIVLNAKKQYSHVFDDIDMANTDNGIDLMRLLELDDMLSQNSKELIGTSDAAKWIKNFQQDLSNGDLVGDVSTGATFDQLLKIKRHLGQTLSRNKQAGVTNVQPAFNDKYGNSILTDFISNIDNTLSEIDVTKKYNLANQQYSLLKTAEDLIPKDGAGANIGEITTFFSNFGGTKGVNKGSIFFESLQQFDAANDTSYAQQVINDVKPILDTFTLTQMAQFKTQFDAATSMVFRGRALASVSPALAPLAAGEPVLIRLANAAGKVNAKIAKTFKVPRNFQGVLQNAPIISKKLSISSPTAAITFNEAYRIYQEEGNPEPLTQLAQEMTAQAGEEFEQGIGFNGKAVTEQDYAKVNSQINDSNLSLSQKMQLSKGFNSTGVIPTENDIPQDKRIRKEYNKRPRVNGRKVNEY